MLSEARSRGLTLKAAPGADPDAFKRVRSTQDKDGRIYDSRNGLGGYYRYGPRSVAALSDTKFSADKRDRVTIAMPKIHESVFERISVDAHVYAPVGLPPVYEILTYDERIVSPDNLTVGPNRPQYESSGSARHREKTQEHVVGSSIWRRRIIYFLTVIASVYLLAYPVASQLPASAEYTTRLRPLSDLIRIVGMALPERALTLEKRLCERSAFVCASCRTCRAVAVVERQPAQPDHRPDALRLAAQPVEVRRPPRHSEPRRRRGRLAEVRLPLPAVDRALSGCQAGSDTRCPKAPEALQIFIDRITTPYFRFFAIAILITMLLKDSTIAWFRLKDGYKQAITTIKLKIAPGLFAVAVPVRRPCAGQPLHFQRSRQFRRFLPARPQGERTRHLPPSELALCKRDSGGNFPATCTAECRGIETEFDTRNSCTSARLKVERRQRYKFEISKKDDWSFLGAPSGPAGMPLREFLPHKDDGWRDSAVALAANGGARHRIPDQALVRPSLWTRHHSLRRNRQRGELHRPRHRAAIGRSIGGDVQADARRRTLRLSQQASQRILAGPLQRRELRHRKDSGSTVSRTHDSRPMPGAHETQAAKGQTFIGILRP